MFGSNKELLTVLAIIIAAAVLLVVGARLLTHPEPHHRPVITNQE